MSSHSVASGKTDNHANSALSVACVCTSSVESTIPYILAVNFPFSTVLFLNSFGCPHEYYPSDNAYFQAFQAVVAFSYIPDITSL